MRKKEITALLLVMAMELASGCAPGEISHYVQRAQQAGEQIFGKTAVQVAADAGETAEQSGETQQSAEEPAQQPGETQQSAEEPAAEASEEAVPQDRPEETAANETQEETEAKGPEAAGNTQMPERETEAKGAAEETGDETKSQPMQLKLPAMMQEVPEKAQEFLQENADQFLGSFIGEGNLDRGRKEAVSAVLEKDSYDDKTLCLFNSARFGGENGSFLFLADYTGLASRGKMNGDLWFFNGQEAVKVAGDMQLLQLRPIQSGGDFFLLVRTQEKETEGAQLYQVRGGICSPCFQDALSIEETGNGFCVTYASEGKWYDPYDGTWSGAEGGIPRFYERNGDSLVQQTVRTLTQKEYLGYIQADEENAGEKEWEEEQEKLFNTASDGNCDYRYSFFAIGEDRIGYRQCRVGIYGQQDETGHAVAEYSYVITLLENGKLTQECEVSSGSGYYFGNWESREQERKELDVIPKEYRGNRIGKVSRDGSAVEISALKAVQEVQEYSEDGLCFIRTADYDGDGTREAFVAAGRYDGAFGAPVCDLWYVSGEMPRLFLENLPVKAVEQCEIGRTSLLLVTGYENGGVSDYLYGVEQEGAKRYLETASRIEIEENGDIRAWMPDADGERPGYYHVLGGAVTEYGMQEEKTEALLEYDNGRIVLKRLEALAGGPENLSCLHRENGLWHLMLLKDGSPISYETYEVQGDALVLVDWGKGGYLAAAEVVEPEEGSAASEKGAPAEGSAASEKGAPAEGSAASEKAAPAEGSAAETEEFSDESAEGPAEAEDTAEQDTEAE